MQMRKLLSYVEIFIFSEDFFYRHYRLGETAASREALNVPRKVSFSLSCGGKETNADSVELANFHSLILKLEKSSSLMEFQIQIRIRSRITLDIHQQINSKSRQRRLHISIISEPPGI